MLTCCGAHPELCLNLYVYKLRRRSSVSFGLVILSIQEGFGRFGNECVMEASKVNQLKLFIQQCDSNPALLQDPALKFFRDYLEKLGAKLPASAYGKGESAKKTEAKDSFVDESNDDMPELEELFGPSSTSIVEMAQLFC